MDTKSGTEAQIPPVSPYVARDPEAFARNVAKAVEEGGRALAAYLRPREAGQPAAEIAAAATDMLKTLSKVNEYWTSDPTRLMQAQMRLYGSYLTIWQNAM